MKQWMQCFLIFITALFSSLGSAAFAQQANASQIAGGRGGNPFADPELAQGARIAEVRVRAGDTIDAVQMIYAFADGRVSPGVRHGGGGGREYTFTLDSGEYITGISGRYGNTVDSMRIHTNQRTSPTFGGGGGDNDFRIDVASGSQATGFVGRSGVTVDAIGLSFAPRYRDADFSRRRGGVQGQTSATTIAGGPGGDPFTDPELPQGARIAEVRVRAGDAVDAVQMVYASADGRVNPGVRHGGRGGRESIFTLDSGEYITGISGRYGNTVDSIRIHTNKRTSPTYGGRGGSSDFRIDVPSGSQATGFVGRSGVTVDAIGLSFTAGYRDDLLSRRGRGVQGQTSATTVAGGPGGDPFTDPELPQGARIAEVRIRAGDTIDAVQMIYGLADGRVSPGVRHGGGGGREYTFTLDSDEYITGISGRYGNTVDSIRFHTNKRTSPTFGGGGGSKDYRIDVPSGSQATKFVGRSGVTVYAIGLSFAVRYRDDNLSRVGGQGQSSATTMAGGSGGSPFADGELLQGARIAEVRVRAGDTVYSVQMIYGLSDGRVSPGVRHGGRGGREYTFTLNSDEYITGISGRYGNTVDSMRIQTNKRTSPTFGGGGGDNDFRIDVPLGSQATGFVGRSGAKVDAIGLSFSARQPLGRGDQRFRVP